MHIASRSFEIYKLRCLNLMKNIFMYVLVKLIEIKVVEYFRKCRFYVKLSSKGNMFGVYYRAV